LALVAEDPRPLRQASFVRGGNSEIPEVSFGYRARCSARGIRPCDKTG